MKCEICRQEITITCDWQQGRCPHRSPMIDIHHLKFYNLFKAIKGFFKRGSST